MSNPKTIFQIEGGLIKRPFTTARYWPALQQQNRQRRAGSEALPFDNAEMNLEAANELMADILKVTFLFQKTTRSLENLIFCTQMRHKHLLGPMK